MVRGTFANVRLRNKLAPGTEGGVTRLLPEGEPMSIFDASVKYAERGIPLIILAGKEYGSGSSRDWAAKGPKLLGVRAVIAESFERIHRSNLVGMGILPLQFARRRECGVARTYRRRDLRLRWPHRTSEGSKFAGGRTLRVKATARRRQGEGIGCDSPHRHAAGDRVLRARRDSAVRAAAVGGEVALTELPHPYELRLPLHTAATEVEWLRAPLVATPSSGGYYERETQPSTLPCPSFEIARPAESQIEFRRNISPTPDAAARVKQPLPAVSRSSRGWSRGVRRNYSRQQGARSGGFLGVVVRPLPHGGAACGTSRARSCRPSRRAQDRHGEIP